MLMVIRAQGYAATTVDDLRASSDVAKGAFFHHCKSKDDLAVVAAEHGSKVTGELFEGAPYNGHADLLERVLGYLDFTDQLLAGDVAEFTCLVDTMVQETFESSPGNSSRSRSQHQRAQQKSRPISPRRCGNTAIARIGLQKRFALHTQAVLQGAFILAKAKDDARSPQPALMACAATSSTCSIRPARKEKDHENHRRDQRGGSH